MDLSTRAQIFKKKVIFAYLVHKYVLSKEEGRKYWIHPFNSGRYLKGAFNSFMIDLREDEEKFFNYFRMSIRSFDELAGRISDAVRGQETNMRSPIRPLEMLAVTLRYLGSGCYLKDLRYSYRLGHSILCKIIRKVLTAIWLVLKDECFPPLTTEKWLEISSEFEKNANFPHCLGALNGKYVRIIKPTKSGSLYFNYKNCFSIVLFAVADANYNFIYIDVGSYGREGDSTVFQNSTFYKHLMNDSLQLPKNKPLPGTQDQK